MKIHIEIRPRLHQGLLSLKKEDGQSLNWLVTRAIRNYILIRNNRIKTKKG